jgi:hypothetical protein
MSHLALSTTYLENLKKSLQNIRYRLVSLGLSEYDLDKSSIIEEQIRRVEDIYFSLQSITNNPEKFLITKK